MKLYKVEITSLPEAAREYYVDAFPDDDALDLYRDTYAALPGWQPDGWDEYCQERWGEARTFWWPSTTRLYQSRSGAKARARLIEAWGATAEIIESAEIVWLTPDIKRALRIKALRAEIEALETAA